MGRELTTSRSRVIGSSDGASQASQRVRSRDLVGTLTECWDPDFPGAGEQRQRQGFVSRQIACGSDPRWQVWATGKDETQKEKKPKQKRDLDFVPKSKLRFRWDSVLQTSSKEPCKWPSRWPASGFQREEHPLHLHFLICSGLLHGLLPRSHSG